MGSGAEAVEETVDYLVNKEEKVGVLKVRLYRPFSVLIIYKCCFQKQQINCCIR
jgi:pyruvate/2-oxoacid:ferredoxin oxidoreductase alpha subunit